MDRAPEGGDRARGAPEPQGEMAPDAMAAMVKEAARIAALANLALGEEETRRLAGELASILTYVRQLGELDLGDVEPTAYVEAAPMPLREDEPEESLPSSLALREAPRASEGGFAVPAFVEED